ncbi:MAG: DUF3606 domain-containing protein, partial [Gemmatimonadaceae bacterium]|nr:DUF3606 domain-containing protein [Gemmatimonadaceae bacterium]
MAMKKSAKKRTAKKATKKAAKKSTKKAVKKATRKVAKKVVKKATRKTVKKAAKKVVKKAAKKTTRKASALKADRARVSKQGPELAYVAKRFNVTKERVIAAIEKVGNMRVDVYAALESFNVRSKAADRAKVSRQPHEVAL